MCYTLTTPFPQGEPSAAGAIAVHALIVPGTRQSNLIQAVWSV